MALNMRPTGLRSGIDKHRPDYTVCCGGWGGPVCADSGRCPSPPDEVLRSNRGELSGNQCDAIADGLHQLADEFVKPESEW